MSKPLPKHIAIVMDGNGRWAEGRGLSRLDGHKAGYEAARSIVRHAAKSNIETLTLFAFSTENWRRPASEVDSIMDLFYQALNHEVTELHENNVQMHIIGDTQTLSSKVQASIAQDKALTAGNTGLKLVIAVNYGGQWDIIQATKRLIAAIQAGDINPDSITADIFASNLSTAGLPDVDLFIRPGGEARISNFLNWQIAYSELYFKLRSHCKFSKIKMIASKARSYATQRYKYTWGQGDLAKLPTSLQAAYGACLSRRQRVRR